MTEERWLTSAEKLREVESFADYRRDPQHFRTAHPDAHGGEGYIDPEVLPLVDALNEIEGVCTVQSCCGHRWPIPGDPHGSESFHPGQLWLRLSEHVSRGADEHMAELLAQKPTIQHVRKLYSYQGMSEPHEVLDVMFAEGAVEEAQDVLVPFFGALSSAPRSRPEGVEELEADRHDLYDIALLAIDRSEDMSVQDLRARLYKHWMAWKKDEPVAREDGEG